MDGSRDGKLVRSVMLSRAAGMLVGALGCNLIDAVIGRDVVIAERLSGQSVGGQRLDCWLTLDFNGISVKVSVSSSTPIRAGRTASSSPACRQQRSPD
jgi:hypothetical protein